MIKKMLGGLLCAAILFTAVGCADNTPSVNVKDVVDKIAEQGYVRAPSEADDLVAKDVYNLKLEDIEEHAIIETQISPGPGFLAVVKAKKGKVDSVKASLEKVKEDMIGRAFYPAEREAAENATVEVVGNIVYFSLFNSEVNEEAQNMIKDLLK